MNANGTKLQEAAKAIEGVASSLDNASGTCECCGMKRYSNFTEHQQMIELIAVAQKLRRFALSNVYNEAANA